MANHSTDEVSIIQSGGNTEIRLKAWVLSDSYTVKILADGSEAAVLKPEVSRYDVCAAFHMPIEDNTYGIEAAVTLNGIYQRIRIVAETGDETVVLADWQSDEKSVLQKSAEKISGTMHNAGRALRWAWKEYHFLVPPKAWKEKLASEKRRVESAVPKHSYDPRERDSYNAWLEKQEYRQETGRADVTFITPLAEENFHGYPVLHQKQLDLSQVNTEYICFAGKDTELYEPFFAYLKDCEGYDFVSFDSDRKDETGRYDPQLKPCFSADTLLGCDYIGDVFVIRKECLKEEDHTEINLYRYLLDLSEKPLKRKHVEKILFADNTKECRMETVEAYLKKRNEEAVLEKTENDAWITHFRVLDEPLVSIIIPTKDLAEDLKICVDSVLEKTTYRNYEILILDNNSEEEETFRFFEEIQKEHDNIRVIEMKMPFNYSRLNNIAIRDHAKGEYIVLLNNDTELISENWLEEMLGWAQRETTGAVGIRLLFADNTIQHAGILMGKGGIAGHCHHGGANDSGYYYDLKIPYNVSGNTAACLMVRKEYFLAVGMMDEELQVAFNDVDLNLKLLKAGYRNIFLPHVMMHHYESKSRGNDIAGEKLKRYMKECAVLQERWQEYIDHDPYYSSGWSRDYDYQLKG